MSDTFHMKMLFTWGRTVEIESVKCPPIEVRLSSERFWYN